jgi:hypothetical protein
MAQASRECGTLDKLIELHETAESARRRKIDQKHLDEAGLQGWWRRT